MQKKPTKQSRKGEKHERPLTLFPLSFIEAVDKLTAKPKLPPKKKKA
jgi:hypothetical protein